VRWCAAGSVRAMSSNNPGSYRTTRENMMRAFDKLPPEVRAALANAVGNWVPQPFLTQYRRGYFSGAAELARWIEVLNARELDKRERERARAVGVYKGNRPDNPIPPDVFKNAPGLRL
jgi:hypothetical protein